MKKHGPQLRRFAGLAIAVAQQASAWLVGLKRIEIVQALAAGHADRLRGGRYAPQGERLRQRRGAKGVKKPARGGLELLIIRGVQILS